MSGGAVAPNRFFACSDCPAYTSAHQYFLVSDGKIVPPRLASSPSEVKFMRKSQIYVYTFVAAALAAPPSLLADFSYQETTQITGGSMLGLVKMAGVFSSQARKVGDPITSSVYLKGNRMARIAPDSTEIIDLDKETITHIDNLKHVYTVITFEQMKEQLAQAQQEMAKKQAEQPAAAPQEAPKTDDVKMSFDVHVRKTGAAKEISGLNATEAIMTMMMNATDQKTQQTGAMAVTNDMWLVPEIPGYSEMRDFSVRMVGKMGTVFSGSGFDTSRFLGQHPGANQALSDMGKEMAKIQGVPVLQVTRIGTTINGQPLPAASEAPLPPDSSPSMPSAGDVAKQSAVSALSSRLGGLGGFGGFGHKKQPDPPPSTQDSTTPPPTSAVLMESQSRSSNFSSEAVDPVHFEVPAGYKEVQPERPRANP